MPDLSDFPETPETSTTVQASPVASGALNAPREVVDFVFEMTSVIDHLEFESSGRGHEPGTWVTVADCSDPAIAGNNCFAATCEVYEAAVEQVGTPPGWRHMRVEVWTENSEIPHNSGVHWANVMQDQSSGEAWVVDYTARQFDTSGPFPWVAEYGHWSDEVSAKILQQYGGQLRSITLHE